MKNKCFAYSEKNVCEALEVKKCRGIACLFFQTQEQTEESRRKAEMLLSGVHPLGQKYIAEKYYGGKIQWMRGGVCK